jgi:hypothetical protein
VINLVRVASGMKDLTASWIAGTKQHASTNKDFDAQAALAARRPLIFLALFVLFDLAPSAEKLRRQLVAGLLLRQPAFRCRLPTGGWICSSCCADGTQEKAPLRRSLEGCAQGDEAPRH